MRIILFYFSFFFCINIFSAPISIKCFYKISEPTQSIKNYSNKNYSIKILNQNQIMVKIKYIPLKIKAKYPFHFKNKFLLTLIKENKKNSENLVPFSGKISKMSKGYYQCVDKVLKFVSKNFVYSSKLKPPFYGDCNVAAETTVKMLALCGIPARIKYVVKFEKKGEVIISGKSLHAVVEVFYPGYGWAFSDPVKYHHFIPASYLLIEKSNNLLGISLKKENCLTKKGFTDILEGKIIINKLPNMFRFF